MAKKITPKTVKGSKPRRDPYEISGQFRLILRIQPSGKKTFYVQLGRGDREKLGDATVMTVERAGYLARQKLNEQHDFGNVVNADPQKTTLGGFIENVYTPWLTSNRRRADKTIKDLKRCFETWYSKRLTEIDDDDLNGYVSARAKDGCVAATIVRDLNNLRSIYRLAMKGKPKYCRVSPFAGWDAPRPDDVGVTRYLDPEKNEEKKLREALAERDDKARRERVSANDWRTQRGYELLPEFSERGFPDHLTPMVLTSLNTGLRYGELTALEWPAVDFSARSLTVTGKTAKGNKTRHLPLNSETLDVLTRWKAQSTGKGLVFSNLDGSRIGTVKTAWIKVLDDAKIEKFRWHDLRHSFASKLVMRGVALTVVRDLLGHGDFNLTLRYVHLDDKQKVDAVARLAA